jgi:hypothetical protein
MFTVGDIIYDAQGNPVGRTSSPGGGQQTASSPQPAPAQRRRSFRDDTRKAQDFLSNALSGLSQYFSGGEQAVPASAPGSSGTVAVGGGGGASAPNGAGQVRNAIFDRRNLMGGALAVPTALFGVQEMLEGRPLSAAAGTAGGLVTGGVTAALTGGLRSSKNPLLKAAGYALPAFAAATGTGAGDLAEKAKVSGKLPFGIGKGEPTAGKEGSLSEQIAQTEKVAEALAGMDARTAQLYIQTQQQLARDAADLDFQNTQRMMPLVERAKRNELVRQQALIATMGQNYAMLGTVATAGKLAIGSQEEQGLNLRTALQAAPYANSVLQAPSISF